MAAWLAGCAAVTEQQLKLARQSMRQGDYAQAFDQADRIVPRFRGAEAMAIVPPGAYQLQSLVQANVNKGIPLSWLDDVHQGYAEDVMVTEGVSSIAVIFNERHEFWLYKIRLSGSYTLETASGKEQALPLNTSVDYRVFRDNFGDWKATFN